MTSLYPEFGRMISECLFRRERNQAWLAGRMGVNATTISRWVNEGFRPKDPQTVVRLADVLEIYDRNERAKLAEAAGFAANFDKGTRYAEADMPDKDAVAAKPDAQFLLQAAAEWGKTMIGWYDDAPEHARSSWAGMTLHALSLLGRRFTPEGVLALCAALALWLFTWHLVAPILRWPLDMESLRRAACVRLAVATVLIPLLLSFITRGEGVESLKKPTWRIYLRLWALKLAGAMTGFDVFVALAVIASLVWYYLTQSPVVGFASGALTFLPVFWGYIAARRIPLDRLKMYEGELRMHSADTLVLLVYPFFGVLLALIIYEWQWLLANPFWGPLVLLACVSIVAGMEARNKRRKRENATG